MHTNGRSIGNRQLGEVGGGVVVGESLGVVSDGVVDGVAVAEPLLLGRRVGESLGLGADPVRDCGCDGAVDSGCEAVPVPDGDSDGAAESGLVVAGSVVGAVAPDVAAGLESGAGGGSAVAAGGTGRAWEDRASG